MLMRYRIKKISINELSIIIDLHHIVTANLYTFMNQLCNLFKDPKVFFTRV